MRHARLAHLGIVGLALGLSCRDATQIRVRVESNLACPGDGATPELREASIVAGERGKVEGPAFASATTCETRGAPNYLGDIVVFPQGDKDGQAEVWVLAAIAGADAVDAQKCLELYEEAIDAGDKTRFPASCIIAKRRLGFVPHEALSLTVMLDADCAGKACDPSTTCFKKDQCVGTEAECNGGRCVLPVEGEGGAGGAASASSGSGSAVSGSSGHASSGDVSSGSTTPITSSASGMPSSSASDGGHGGASSVVSSSSGGMGGAGGGPACPGVSQVVCTTENLCNDYCVGQGLDGCCDGGFCFCACVSNVNCNVHCVGLAYDSGSCIDENTCHCVGMGGAGGNGGAGGSGSVGNGPAGSGGGNPVSVPGGALLETPAERRFFERRFDPEPPTLASHVKILVEAARAQARTRDGR